MMIAASGHRDMGPIRFAWPALEPSTRSCILSDGVAGGASGGRNGAEEGGSGIPRGRTVGRNVTSHAGLQSTFSCLRGANQQWEL
jgi:hypothetical protein